MDTMVGSASGPDAAQLAGLALSRVNFASSASSTKCLDVITEENEVLITQAPDTASSASSRIRQSTGKSKKGRETPHEGLFVHIGDIERYIIDCDRFPTPTSDPVNRRRKTGTHRMSPLPIKADVSSSDDEDYETDLEYDEEAWLNPEKPEHDITGKSKYVKVCSHLGVTPVTSYLERLQEKEISLKYYGLSVPSAKAISVPFETNTVTEKLNLEGNGIEKEATKYLCRILKDNLYITELVLRDNTLGRDGAVAVCDLMMINRCITKLDLSGNGIEDSCAVYFANILAKNTSLKHLRLAHNGFEDLGARHFQEAISENESLELLDLSWNHFSRLGAALLAQGLQENVGLKHFDMPMAGVGSSGCQLMGDVLRNNRTLLELDISFCRIPVSGVEPIACGLRENDVLQVLKIGSNPIDAACAMALLTAVEENDSSALTKLDLKDIFVKADFVTLANKLHEKRGLAVVYEGVLPAPPKFARSVEEMVRFREDPVGHLRHCLQQRGDNSPSAVFHLNGPAKITRQEFADTIGMAQLDLTKEQIHILFSKLHTNGLIDIEHLLDLLENPPTEPEAELEV